jgi:hypothetical protein
MIFPSPPYFIAKQSKVTLVLLTFSLKGAIRLKRVTPPERTKEAHLID